MIDKEMVHVRGWYTHVSLVFREDISHLYLPRDIEGAKDLGRVLSKYKESHYYSVMAGVLLMFILYPHYSHCVAATPFS